MLFKESLNKLHYPQRFAEDGPVRKQTSGY